MTDKITGNYRVPHSWIWADLDQLCEITSGNPAPQNKDLFENGKVPFVRVQDMGRMGNNVYIRETKDYLNKEAAAANMKLFPKGSVLFTKSGMSILLNQRAILGSKMHVVSHIGVCLPTKFTSSEWIYYWLKTIDFKDLTHATTLPSLKLSKAKKIKIPFPPLLEQHRIVAKIEELFTKLDAGVKALKQVQVQLKHYRQSVLKAAADGRLTAKWREQHKNELEPADKLLERIQKEQKAHQRKKYKEPRPFNTPDLPELPNSWKWANFGHIGELNRGKSKHRPRNDPKLYNGEYPFVQTGDIRNANKLVRRYSQTYNEVGLKQSRLWPKGTLCITIAANIADTAILDFDACFPDSIVGFTPNQLCNIFFVEYFIRTAKENLNRYAPATAQKNINLKILSGLLIPLPPKIEQDKIVDELDRIFSVADQLDSIINSELKRAQSLRQSILKRAFEGKLVPQDPNDEPASVLLERIKAEKAKTKQSKQLEMF